MRCGARLRYWAYCVSSAMINFSTFYFWVCISLLAYGMGATPLQLGLIQAASSTITTTTSPLMGILSDKLRAHWLVRASSFVFAASCAVLLAVCRVSVWLYLIPVMMCGLTCAAYWPTVQATVAKEVDQNNVNRDMSRFAVFWSVGKSVGYMVAGYIFQYAGGKYSLAVPAVAAGSVMLWYPCGAPGCSATSSKEEKEPPSTRYLKLHEEPTADAPDTANRISMEDSGKRELRTSNTLACPVKSPQVETVQSSNASPAEEQVQPVRDDIAPRTKDASTQTRSEDIETKNPEAMQEIIIDMKKLAQEKEKATEMSELNSRFLPLVYMLNFCVYGTLSTLSSQLIHLIKEYDLHIGNLVTSDQYLGVFMCTLFAVQTVMFVVFSMSSAWLYRLWLMFLVEGVLVSCLWGIAFIPNSLAVLAFGVGIGACAAFAVQSSIMVSLRMSDDAKGKYAGINETIVSGGSAAVPLVAGAVASVGAATARTPYVTCGLLIAGCGVAQGCWYMAQEILAEYRAWRHAKEQAGGAGAGGDSAAKKEEPRRMEINGDDVEKGSVGESRETKVIDDKEEEKHSGGDT
ncbi:major facilitator superfamily protein [Pelomyxa schiedti]|nr:major facilitator superfamily protein [Pelomyxa schiedti]